MILPLLGLGGIVLAAMALSSSSRPSASAPAAPPPTALPPPTEAAQHVREGNPTSEDYESLAREAERQGAADTAEQLRERATEVPTQREVEAVTPPLPPGYTSTDNDTSDSLSSPREAEQAASDPSQPDTEDDQIPAPTPDPEATSVAPAQDPNNPAPGFTPPAGFNPGQARSLARRVADDIRSRQYSYNRANLRAFQTAAGVSADGIYGRESRGALAFYGVQNPPRPLFGSASDMAYPEALAYHAERIENAGSGSLFDPPPYVDDSDATWVGFESEASDPYEISELLAETGYSEVGMEIVGNKKRRRRVLGAIFGGPIGALAAIRRRRRDKKKRRARR